MRQRDAEPVHAFGTVGREARIVFADASGVAHYLWEIKFRPPLGEFPAAAQDRHQIGVRWVPPDRIGRDDGIGRSLVDRIAKRQRQAAFRGLDAVCADIVHAFVVATEAQAPSGLDRARRGIVDHVDKSLLLAADDFGACILECHGGSGISVAGERHVGQATMCRDGRRLACRALERRHIGRGCCLRVRRDVVVGDLELAHGKPPVISG